MSISKKKIHYVESLDHYFANMCYRINIYVMWFTPR